MELLGKNIDYRRLLLMSLLAYYNNEGVCWGGNWGDNGNNEAYGIDPLSEDEMVALREVLDEAGGLVGEEFPK
jgi:hypothetical protein